MSIVQTQFVNALLERVKQSFGLESDAELSRLLDVRPNVVSNWRRRGSLDYEVIVERCAEQDLNWILTGRERNRGTTAEPSSEYSIPDIVERVRWFADQYPARSTFAADVRMTSRAVAEVLDRVTPLDLPMLLRLEAAGCNVSWLVSGKGERFADNPAGRGFAAQSKAPKHKTSTR